jgi:hypothetical protein
MIFGTADDGTPNTIGTSLLALYPVDPKALPGEGTCPSPYQTS